MDSKASAPPLEVFIVEDSPVILERLLALLASVAGVRTVGCVDRADDAIRAILEQRPDAVVLDLQLDEGSGFDVLRSLRDQAPGIDVLVLTNFASSQYRRQCERLGARGFYDKSNEFERLRDAIAARASSRSVNPGQQPCRA